ncbi:MAG TPA: AMP-binding protein [Steroidobacter sp.]|uniref:AMP-binding protein n=1 Tax=Steroidobacter sp. TaxID=1978227 RepID=UPI002EDA6362
MSQRYFQTWQRSRTQPREFWAEAASDIDWYAPPSTAFDANAGVAGVWFAGGRLNTCYNAVDRHVRNGRGAQAALIYHSAVTGQVRRFSFAELQSEVAKLAGLLRQEGVLAGDRVVIYMPMVPEAVFAMLACARLGAIHSVVFGGFAAPELAKRIDDAQPRVVLSASCGIEPGRAVAYKPILDAALGLCRHRVERCVILQRPQVTAALDPIRDIDWSDALRTAQPADCAPVASEDPLYILYTSGTTGIPKGVVRDNGGHAVALSWSMRHIYGAQPGSVFWAASDIGWVVGHSYIVYAPLLIGCTTVLYEGKPVGTPDAGMFWRVAREHDVEILFTAPTALRAIKREDPDGAFIKNGGLGRLRTLFLAGERADPPTLEWAQQRLGIPVFDHWWQTELGWPGLATCTGLGAIGARHGSAGRAVPGYEFAVLDPEHRPLPRGTSGDIAIRLPLPPGCLQTLWRNDAGFRNSYLSEHPGYYTTGDAGFIDDDGFVHVMGRTDDIINVAGHRISSGAIEQVIASHPDVAECAVVGASDPIKGSVPIALFVLKAGVTADHASIIAALIEMVRDTIGAVASFKAAAPVAQLPKTRSGKILRGAIRRLADGEACPVPPTIDDPAALDRVIEALHRIRYASSGGAHGS